MPTINNFAHTSSADALRIGLCDDIRSSFIATNIPPPPILLSLW